MRKRTVPWVGPNGSGGLEGGGGPPVPPTGIAPPTSRPLGENPRAANSCETAKQQLIAAAREVAFSVTLRRSERAGRAAAAGAVAVGRR